MSKAKMRVACVQTNTGGDVDANIEAIDGFVREAAAQGAGFIALPENAYYMRGLHEIESHYHTMDDHPGVAHSCSLAKELGVWILIGSVFVTIDDSGKWANRSVLINAQGEIVSTYDKIHLFDADFGDGERYRESDTFLSGKQMRLAEVPCGTLGMGICYDMRFPKLFRDMARSGATIFSLPAAFTYRTGVAHWHVMLRARAIENGSYVIAPAQCGTHPKNRHTYGHSLIIDPWGEVLADAGESTGVIVAEIDPERLQQVRTQMPVLTHDRDYILNDYVI